MLVQRGRVARPAVMSDADVAARCDTAMRLCAPLASSPSSAAALALARRTHRRSPREALRRLAEQPVVGVLARVLSYVTGDKYLILTNHDNDGAASF